MDYAIRQSILHLYVFICLFFALKYLLREYFQPFFAIGAWVKKWSLTNRHKPQIPMNLTLVGIDPKMGLTIGVCDEECGSRVGLIDLRKKVMETYPRSCEHCYCCGRLLGGSYEKGCMIHHDPNSQERAYCPNQDYTSTELFQETIRIVARQERISDFLWQFTRELTKDYPYELPGSLAAVILQTPKKDC